MESSVRLAGLVESLDHVCCRYRLRAFAPGLARAGHSLHLNHLPQSFWQRLQIGRQLADFDQVIIQRKLLGSLETRLLRSRVRRLIFDLDDAVWLRDSYAASGLYSSKRQRRFRSIVSRCDAIAAGNSFLAEYAAECAPHAHVNVIPTCIDVDRYTLAKHELNDQTKLVWVGSSSTLKGLESERPLLEQIGKAVPGITLKLICDRFLKFDQLKVDECRWSETTEAREIAAADIGISLIPDDPWSRGKCGLKVLQYMAAGLPVIANPVGVQAEMVRDGETGLLAATSDEWIDAVRTLAGNPDLRRRMGQNARRMAEEHYSLVTGVRLWASLIENSQSLRKSA